EPPCGRDTPAACAAACQRGSADACFWVGVQSREGARALAGYRRACELGHRQGCTTAALLVRRTDPHGGLAEDLTFRSCTLGFRLDCLVAGYAALGRDAARAQEALRRACSVATAPRERCIARVD